MKHFIVYLRDGREVHIHAETYRHDGEQYVFDKPGSSEVQFFHESDVAGIVEATPAAGAPIHRSRGISF
jgi:hypothetical protein